MIICFFFLSYMIVYWMNNSMGLLIKQKKGFFNTSLWAFGSCNGHFYKENKYWVNTLNEKWMTFSLLAAGDFQASQHGIIKWNHHWFELLWRNIFLSHLFGLRFAVWPGQQPGSGSQWAGQPLPVTAHFPGVFTNSCWKSVKKNILIISGSLVCMSGCIRPQATW